MRRAFLLPVLLLIAAAPATNKPAPKPKPKPVAPKTVEFRTDDNWLVSASWRAAKKGRPTVILTHGVASARGEWDAFAARLSLSGIGTLLVDLRGHGASLQGPDGRSDFASFDARRVWPRAVNDLRAAAWWLRGRGVPDAKIAFGGASIGANLASRAASEAASAPFLLLLSPAEDYRGVGMTVRPGLKTLAAASPADTHAFVAVKRLASNPDAKTVFAPKGHGVQLLDDAKTASAIEAWILSSSK